MESKLTRIVLVFYMLLYDHRMYFVSMLYLSNGCPFQFHKTSPNCKEHLCEISYVENQQRTPRTTNPI